MRIIDAATTRRHLGFPTLISALRQRFIAGCEVPLRHTHRMAQPDGSAASVLLMPAWRSGGRFGLKTVVIHPANHARGLPALHSTYLLSDATTGVPLALIDGDEITTRRTAAASALAASYLSRTDASGLLIVGAGRVAGVLAEAMRSVRPIVQVRIWNHRPAGAELLAAALRAEGIDAEATLDLQGAVAEADIVSCATLATAPLIRGAWLAPGTHLDLIGSFTPAMREADADCFARCRVVVDTAEALAKSGDVQDAIAAGTFRADALHADLAQLCRGAPGRRNDDECTLFKSVGNALEDLAAAECVYDGFVYDGLAGTTAPG